MIRHLIRHTLPAARAFDWRDTAATLFLLALTVGALMFGG
jgi:hypothetical protein